MPPKRKAQQADLDISTEPDSSRTPLRSSRVATVKEKTVDAAPVAKSPRGRPPRKSTLKKLPPKAVTPKNGSATVSTKKPFAKAQPKNTALEDDADNDLEVSEGLEDDIDPETLQEAKEDVEEQLYNNTAPTADNDIPGAHPAYKDMLSPDAVVFIFSKSFHDALREKANNCPRKHGVSAEKAIEEFRRLIAIKSWTVDVDAAKISPTPIMDDLWHAAVLDTEFYAQLQSALGVKLRHNPKGASEQDFNNRQKRLTRMAALYKTFFGDEEPLVSKQSYVASVLPFQQPVGKDMTILIRSLLHVENALKLGVHQDNAMHDINRMIEEREGIPWFRQRLIYGGRQQPDDRTLKDLNIKHGATIWLVLSIRGC
ncbi:ubiquitin-like protein 1 [Paraphaeosphaeria sporulosa]